jgi:hypothetical protein
MLKICCLAAGVFTTGLHATILVNLKRNKARIRAGLSSGKTLKLLFWRCLVRNSVRTSSTLTEVSHRFRQPLQANTGIVSQLSHGRLLTNPFQLVIHKLSYHLTPYSLETDSVGKWPRRKGSEQTRNEGKTYKVCYHFAWTFMILG